MIVMETLSLLRAWLSNPLVIGAIAPSGPMLAELMAREISPEDAPVIELGPGTGPFTRALLAQGVCESDLTLIECHPNFTEMLDQRFPEARVLSMDAARLIRANLFAGAPVGAVVSGLPLLSMKPRKVIAILAGAFGYMRPDGAFYQFTYGPACPVPRRILDRLGLKARRIGHAPVNVPPATVYRISRRPVTVPGFRLIR